MQAALALPDAPFRSCRHSIAVFTQPADNRPIESAEKAAAVFVDLFAEFSSR